MRSTQPNQNQNKTWQSHLSQLQKNPIFRFISVADTFRHIVQALPTCTFIFTIFKFQHEKKKKKITWHVHSLFTCLLINLNLARRFIEFFFVFVFYISRTFDSWVLRKITVSNTCIFSINNFIFIINSVTRNWSVFICVFKQMPEFYWVY